MKPEIIDLIRNTKLKNMAFNGGNLDQAMQIASKVKAKSESDSFAQAALIWEMRGELDKSIQSAKNALAAHVLERNIANKPTHSADASFWYQNVLKTMESRVDSVFGRGSFDSIEYYFNQRF